MAALDKIYLSGVGYDLQDVKAPETWVTTAATVGSGDYSGVRLYEKRRGSGSTLYNNFEMMFANINGTSVLGSNSFSLQPTLSAGTGIDITNNVISVTGGGGGGGTIDSSLDDTSPNAVANSAITNGINAVSESLSGYVTTDTAQNITGQKTFVGTKMVYFDQSATSDKLGFTLHDNVGGEFGAFELNPSGITINNVRRPLMTLNHYRGNGSIRDVQTTIGIRQYDSVSKGAYNLLAPLPENAKTPFSLTTSIKNLWIPIGVKSDSSTIIRAENSGVIDLSTAFAAKADAATTSSATEVSTALAAKQNTLSAGSGIDITNDVISVTGGGGGGGSNVVELTQAQYDALATKDPDTFYIITDATEIDASSFYTTAQTSSSTQISTALALKADAATTSSATEVSTALAAKQNTLSAGTGIDITNDVISVTGGGGGGTIDASLDSSSPNAVANSAITASINAVSGNVITSYTNAYDGQGRTGLWAYAGGREKDNISIFASTINNKDIIAGGYSNRTHLSVNLSLVETSAITTTLSSSSTDSQVPSAKAVYDIVGNINALLSAI